MPPPVNGHTSFGIIQYRQFLLSPTGKNNCRTSPLHHVVIKPQKTTLEPGETKQFTAQAQDINNLPISGLTYKWAVVAGGGTIDISTGLFTAGTTAGAFDNAVQVTVDQNLITRTALASVKVTSENESENEQEGPTQTPPGWSQGKKTGWQGENMPPGLLKDKSEKNGKSATTSTSTSTSVKNNSNGNNNGKSEGKGH